ncbi:transcription factor GATA-6-like [Nomascus leucogenys]|uniref:transcription factor GATA-6-like n=1 Tax=Nomascus leucogenys TaxID=61853 RepID=UPI00122DB8AB|nr:transcription factor GATA-6-like [Nomascus leucogenys]
MGAAAAFRRRGFSLLVQLSRLGGSLPRRPRPGFPASMGEEEEGGGGGDAAAAEAGAGAAASRALAAMRVAPEVHRQPAGAAHQVRCVQGPHPAGYTDPGGKGVGDPGRARGAARTPPSRPQFTPGRVASLSPRRPLGGFPSLLHSPMRQPEDPGPALTLGRICGAGACWELGWRLEGLVGGVGCARTSPSPPRISI